jgi:hypothetical protein
LTDVSEVLIASVIALMMEAVSTSQTSANFYQTTRRNIPEDSHLHIRRRKKLKSHKHSLVVVRLLAQRIEEILKRQWQGGVSEMVLHICR